MPVYFGNAPRDAPAERGWLLGHFQPPGSPLHSTDVEVKWGVHPAGDRRAAWATGETRTAMLLLISGTFTLEFRDRAVTLAAQGDYVVWSPGEDHTWHAPSDAVVLTVRWPSVPGWRLPEP
jgi:hypothetical protein